MMPTRIVVLHCSRDHSHVHMFIRIDAGEYGLIPDEDDVGHGHSHGGHPKPHPKMRWRDVWTLVFGVLLPLALNLPHGH